MKKFWFSYLQSALVALITIDGKMRSHAVRRARENISTATTQFHSLSVEWSMLDRRPSFASIYRQLWLIQPGRKNFRLSIMAKYSLIGWIKPKCHSIGGVAMFFFFCPTSKGNVLLLFNLPSFSSSVLYPTPYFFFLFHFLWNASRAHWCCLRMSGRMTLLLLATAHQINGSLVSLHSEVQLHWTIPAEGRVATEALASLITVLETHSRDK